MPRMSTIQDRLKELRRDKPEVKNAHIAKLAGIAAPSVSAWFNDEPGPSELKWVSVDAVATLYGVRPRWVVLGEGPKYPASPWPFSNELHGAVSELGAEDLRFAENALRSHLKMETLPISLGGEGKNGTEHR